jgi:hypothetical protein
VFKLDFKVLSNPVVVVKSILAEVYYALLFRANSVPDSQIVSVVG